MTMLPSAITTVKKTLRGAGYTVEVTNDRHRTVFIIKNRALPIYASFDTGYLVDHAEEDAKQILEAL